ncbi:trigger factor family protein, partial [bacterium]|nr:trigger factor family protein [bacterium]
MPKTSSKANAPKAAKTPSKIYSDISVKKLPKSQVEITGKIAADALESFRAKALKNINDEVTIDGFRKGNVPEKILIAKVGDMTILEEMAELALSTAYPSIVVEEKIDAIGRPEIGITKLAKDNPLEFKIVTTVIPDITLADYKKVAADENKKAEEKATKEKTNEVTDAEVEDAIKRIRTSHAAHNHKHEDGDDHSSLSKEEHDKLLEAEMPPLDDEFVKTVGDFKD